MKWRIALTTAAAIVAASLTAHAQFVVTSGRIGIGAPGPLTSTLQFNTNGIFGSISGVTSDQANIGFATSSQLILYGIVSGNCLKVGANNQIADAGTTCGGSGAPGGTNGQVQFNTNGAFGGISGATSNASNISFTTNSLVINGQAISKVSGTTGTLATVTGSLSTNCVKGDGSGNLIDSGTTCGGGGGGSTTSIAAGTNITTSGVATNTTVNVVATPSFTTVIATSNLTAGFVQVSSPIALGAGPLGVIFLSSGNLSNTNFTLTVPGANDQLMGRQTTDVLSNKTFDTSGNILRINGQSVTATTGNVPQIVTASGTLSSGHCPQWDTNRNLIDSGSATCGGIAASSTNIAAGTNITTSGTTSNVTVNVVATPSFTTVIASSNITGGSAQFTGALSGTTGQFQTLTVTNLTPTGPNCLQETGGILQATNVSCATQVATISIAAGNNITTSGTSANITVTATPTGPSGAVQFDNAGVFGGDSGFQYAGSSTGIVTHSLGTVTTTNDKALSLVGNWSNSTTTFAAPLFVNIITNTTGLNTTNGFAAGSKFVDIQASSASIFSVFPNGATINSSLTGTTIQAVGWLTAAGSNLSTATIAGALIGSTGNFSSNLTASTVLGIVGWVTGPGANFQTETLAGALIGTSGNFSTNLTANIAQFAGFMSAGGASLAGLTIQTETLSGALIGTTGNFSSNVTATTAQIPGWLTAAGANFSTLTISAPGQTTQTTAFVTSVVGNAGTNSEGSISFLTNNVVQFGDSGLNANGYFNWGGEARLSADSAGLITTGFGNLMTVNVKGGRTYKFVAELPLKSATASTGGIGLRIGGGASATSVVYDGWVIDSGFNGTKGNTQATALSTTVASTSITGTTSHATLIGTISVNAAGSIILQASGFSTVTAASAVTVGRGATFIVEDMP